MNEQIPDDDLKALFARQRTADHDRMPRFHAMRTRALTANAALSPVVPSVWRWALPGAAVLGLGFSAILWLQGPAKTPVASREAYARRLDQIDGALQKSLAAQHALTAWQSPTDFLINPTPTE